MHHTMTPRAVQAAKCMLATSMLVLLAVAIAAPSSTGAQVADPRAADQQYGLGSASSFTNVGLGKEDDLKGTLATVINIALGFLGIIAVIIVMFGGFKWMTAAGNEEQVGEARKLIVGGVVGLLVIFMAWAIASFVVSSSARI
ncbi:MAG: hypothetical protein HYT31_04795 [Parcubacteria group bacterium]|nr:hypothetical protein [Parcubacteria group bacterium]